MSQLNWMIARDRNHSAGDVSGERERESNKSGFNSLRHAYDIKETLSLLISRFQGSNIFINIILFDNRTIGKIV